MGYLSETQAIRTLFNAGWDNATYPVEWPNRNFVPPKDANGKPKAYARFSIASDPLGAAQITLGTTATHRHTGIVFVSVFVPLDDGEVAALTLADTAAAIFRGQSTSGITFRSPSVVQVGPDGAYYQVNVSAPFWRDTIF